MIDSTKEIFRWGPIPGRFYYMSEFIEVCSKFFGEKYQSPGWPETILLFRDEKMVWVNRMESLRSFGKDIFIQYMVNPKTRKKIYENWKKELSLLLQFQEKITPQSIKKSSKSELNSFVEEFFRRTINFWIDTIPAELGNYGSEEVLITSLNKFFSSQKKPISKEELSSIMEILSAPEKPSFYQEEEIELAEINGHNDINLHQKKYFWLQNSYAGTKILSKEYFSERAEKINKNLRKEVNERLSKIHLQKKETIKKYKLPKDIVEIAGAISENISWQDERKKHIFINLHYKNLILNEISRRFQYKQDDLLNAWYTELLKIISDNCICKRNSDEDLHQILQKRRDGFGIHFAAPANSSAANPCRELSSPETVAYWEKYVYEKIINEINQFEGVVASKGKNQIVRGKVKIVLDPFRAESFQKGDILIAPMTSPEYVFLMEKAAAIVTDTGGLTCHAAIVSREFEIPCIVGTKVATQILKDRDLIEVNTEKGIVKIVKKI